MKKQIFLVLCLLLVVLVLSKTGHSQQSIAVDSVPVDPSASIIAVSPDKRSIYVGERDSGLKVIDLGTKSVITTIPLTPARLSGYSICTSEVLGIVVAQPGNQISGGIVRNGIELTVIDHKDFTIKSKVFVENQVASSTRCALSANNKHFYLLATLNGFDINRGVYGTEDRLIVLNDALETEARLRIPDINIIMGAATSPTEDKLYIVGSDMEGATGPNAINAKGGRLVVVSENQVKKSIQLKTSGAPWGEVVFSPDGRYAYISAWDGLNPAELAIVDTRSEEIVIVQSLAGTFKFPTSDESSAWYSSGSAIRGVLFIVLDLTDPQKIIAFKAIRENSQETFVSYQGMPSSFAVVPFGKDDQLVWLTPGKLNVLLSPNPGLELANTTNPFRSGFLVGDSWQLSLRGLRSDARQPIYLHLWKDGQNLGISGAYGVTDAQGNWTLKGAFQEDAAGSWKIVGVMYGPDGPEQSHPIEITISKANRE